MKQMIQDARSHVLQVDEMPAPSCRPRGVLVRNIASLISSGTERALVQLGEKSLLGMAIERPDLVRTVLQRLKTHGISDVLATVRARLDICIPLGYSSSGVVLELGQGTNEFTVGSPVACAGAGYASHAEVIWVPKNLCVTIPPQLDFDSAAAVGVGAIALEGVRVGEAKLGDRVAVVGLGLVGLLTVQILRAAGCAVWGIDPDPDRVRMALELGAEFACENRHWPQSAIRGQCENGKGADTVILTAATRSAEPIEMAGMLARDRGIVCVVGDVGLSVPRSIYYKKGLQVRLSRSYGPGRYDPEYEEKGNDYPYGFVRWTEQRNMQAFLELMAQQKVSIAPLLTHRFRIDQAAEAYRLLTGDRNEKHLGILVEYPAKESPKSARLATLRAKAVRESGVKTSNGTLSIGWIGAGSFSQAKLIPIVRGLKGIELKGIANATGISAKRVAKLHGFHYCTTDHREVLGDADVDAVFIGTRHDLHGSLVVDALERGKHVFVEKPLCVNEEELRKIADAHALSGRILTVGFNRRFSPFARGCRELFEGCRDPLSIVYRVNAGRVPHGHWVNAPEQGQGRVVGEVCHFVDLMSYLAGSVPAKVQAWPTGVDNRNFDDSLHIRIVFENESQGDIFYLSNGDTVVPKERIEVFGAGRTAICEDFRRSHFYSAGRHRIQFLLSQDKGHREELKAFLEAVRSTHLPPMTFDSLFTTTLATFRIRESLACGKGLPV